MQILIINFFVSLMDIRLRENCRKSNASVRRDRVYCCYAEKCGTERVSVLNPASFGKLVRIIFPNVQTRRLGVRGESKYHYVDLSIIEPEPQLGMDSNGIADGSTGAIAENSHASLAKEGRYETITIAAVLPVLIRVHTTARILPKVPWIWQNCGYLTALTYHILNTIPCPERIADAIQFTLHNMVQ